MNLMIIGGGTDGGGWYIGPDGKIHKIPGWNPDGFRDFQAAVGVIREAAQIKSTAISEQVIKSAFGFAQRELSAHFKEGTVVAVA